MQRIDTILSGTRDTASVDIVDRCRSLFANGDFSGVIAACEGVRETPSFSAECCEWIGYANLCLGEHEAAEVALIEARRMNSNLPGVHVALGDIALRRGDAAVALSSYLMARDLGGLSVDEHVNLEYLCRGAGDFRAAARETEWQLRRNKDNPVYYNRGLLVPRWQGEPLGSASLLVHWADGFGDNLQHVRFIRDVIRIAPQITLDCPRELYRLFKTSFPEIETILADDDLPREYDFYTSILTLSAFSPRKCEAVPPPPYLFPTERVRSIPSDTGRLSRRALIGICWRGSDYAKSRSIDESCLRQLCPLGTMVSLQEGHTESEIQMLSDSEIVCKQRQFIDFLDTANCIEQLDCVLSVDTAVAHLAGAMGKPTVLLLADPVAPMWASAKVAVQFYPSIVPIVKPRKLTWSEFLNQIMPTLSHIVARAQYGWRKD